MKIGGVWIGFEGARGLSKGLFVMAGVIEGSNGGNEVPSACDRLFKVSQCGMTLTKRKRAAISKWARMIDD